MNDKELCEWIERGLEGKSGPYDLPLQPRVVRWMASYAANRLSNKAPYNRSVEPAIIQIQTEAMLGLLCVDYLTPTVGERINSWASERFDAVRLAKEHGNEVGPDWVDLIVGPGP